MIQLIGHWAVRKTEGETISKAAALEGLTKAQKTWAAGSRASVQQAYNYRNRLVDADMVTAGRGTAKFSLPYLRDYLREHVFAELLD